jgi:hypothetical protein
MTLSYYPLASTTLPTLMSPFVVGFVDGDIIYNNTMITACRHVYARRESNGNADKGHVSDLTLVMHEFTLTNISFTRDQVPVSLKIYLKWQLTEPLKLTTHGYHTPFDALK